jgi:methylenetetrahydrofolate dehydrogenase (NADP+)/methenyltetrahydrofolate cyclohydrolase
MAHILDGKKARAELKQALIQKRAGLSVQPHLVIIQVGDRPDSAAYISAKKKFAAEIGVRETHITISESADEKEVIRVIENANADPSVHGIIVQLPLPLSMDADAVMHVIDPEKDVDGLTETNVKKWLEGRADALWPATTRGIRELLDFYDVPLEGKHVVMVGRSSLVGKPTAAMCLAENATVTVCHSKTKNVAELTRSADVIIVAVGRPAYIGAGNVKSGQTVIDVGITADSAGKLVGDVDYDAVVPIIGSTGAITPVPGGVGVMTVLALFENLVDACYNKNIAA